ncbi:MAG: glycosyltransferase family 2 protein [Acidobacteriota bacterium]|nr:glycosyltransferase family 2 protein [Acidobacteriota bacterium]
MPPSPEPSTRTVDRSLFSIIVPIYNEEETLEELSRRITLLFDKLDFDACEAVIVNDGSQDESEEMIRAIIGRDPRFRGVFLSRNFGHQAAVSVGLHYARGSVIAVIDGDLQDPPETVLSLIAVLDRGADVAYGVRRRRKESWVKRSTYWLFYRLLASVSPVQIPLDAGDFCCMTRQVVDALNSLPENRRFVRGLRSWVGFRQVRVEFERDARFAGTTKYSWSKLIRLAYDGIFSLSGLPIKIMQITGFASAALSLILGLGYFIASFLAESPPGFPTLVISVWLLGGLQVFFLGILGEYIHRAYEQSLGRPVAIVREVLEAAEP